MNVVSNIINDILSFNGVPGTNTLNYSIKILLENRLNIARDILIGKLKAGSITINDDQIEESVAILYRYMRAAQEGAGRINLQLMAEVILGQIQLNVLRSNEFLHYASILESLSYEEILLIGNLFKHWSADPENAMKNCKLELIPNLFKTEDDWVAIASSSLRTGLLHAKSGWGCLVYEPTSLMTKLQKLAPFEVAIYEL